MDITEATLNSPPSASWDDLMDILSNSLDEFFKKEDRIVTLLYVYQSIIENRPILDMVRKYGWTRVRAEKAEPSIYTSMKGFTLLKDLSEEYILHLVPREEPLLEMKASEVHIITHCSAIIREIIEKISITKPN